MMLPDGIRLLVPATWKVLGAKPVSMVPNKGLAEGRLEPFPAGVPDLLEAGIDPPGALLRAEGVNGQQDLPMGGQEISRPVDSRNPGGRTADLRVTLS